MKSSNFCTLRLLALLVVSVFLNASVMRSAEGAIRLDPVLQLLASPVYVTNADDGSNRLFVVEQGGQIRALAADRTTLTLFVDITSKVLSGGERGLLGLAFHPQFATNSRFFVYYTRQGDGAIVIAEYHALATPAATAASEIILLTIPHPGQSNHNGGMIEFGPDGFLYAGTGDGGAGNDPPNNAQNINVLLGKILRIDVDVPAAPNLYSSPPSNPFFGATPGADEIFAVGMRNPFRFSFDRAGTPPHQLYVGDVGQGAWEEVDIVTLGGNYGWRAYEGNHCILGPCAPPLANYVPPIAEYAHTLGRCSITGGYVYRGSAAAVPAGTYVFGDYCTGEIFSLAGGVSSLLLDTALNISSFGEDEAGEIYVVGLGGTVHRIASTATTTTLTSSGSPALAGGSVTFTATVAGSNPTGSVTFTELGNAICPAGTLSGTPRTASCSTSSLAVGVHSIVANYPGDSGNAPSSSTALSQVINGTVVPAAATFVGTDVATKGNWQGVYGADGYAILNDSTSYPAYAQVTPSGQQSYVWDAQPSDARALQRATSGRIAACWFSPAPVGSSFSVDINLTDGAAHQVALYLLDWDAIARVTRIDVLDAATQQVLSSQTLQAYSGGVYLVWNLQGHVTLRFTALAGQNAVLSGLFFDAPASLTTYTVSGTVTTGGNPLPGVSFAATGTASCPGASNAQGQYSCTVPQGWSGSITPALSGYAFTPSARNYSSVAANQTGQDYTATAALPTAATFVGTDVATKGNWQGVYGADGYAILNDSTSYPAYAQVTPSGQQSYVWDAQPSDARALQRATSGRIAACWFSPAPVGSSFSVDINLTDGAAHRVALYLLDWDAIARVTRIDVLDAATQQVLSTQTLQAYSGGVYLVWNLQGHVTLRFTALAGQNAVLSGLFFDAPAGVTTYTVSGTVTSGGNPLSGVNFAATGTASCPGASNAQGQYSCTVPQGWSGSITPSLSGYAFTPSARDYSSVAANQTAQNYAATSTTVPAAATFVGTDVATKGNWQGIYGAQGRYILNDSAVFAPYAQVTPSGQSAYVWDAQPDSDPRALQRLTTGGRIAACWFSPAPVGSSFSVDINLTDGAAHRVALYLLDWDAIGRVTRIDVLDAATQQVLSTQTLQSFNGGVYLVWNLQGHVIVRFTSTGGSNAVLSGLFFDAPASLTTYTVSGTVTTGGNPLPGVSFAATGTASCPAASNAQGQYSCTVPQGWSGSITPALSGYVFTPATRNFSNVANNQTAQDFAASAVAGGSAPWNTFAGDAQHTALSTTASQSLNQIHWQTPMDLQPQYSGTSLLIHYGSPLVTSANTVIVPVKTGPAGEFRVDARGGTDGALKWSMTTDYILPPASWIPAFGPALTSQPRLYFPGAGGTVYFRDQPDAISGASGQIAFYGMSNYLANPQAYNASVFINTPITSDPSGNIYFGVHITGSNPLGMSSGIVRIGADGVGTATSVITASADPGMTRVPHNSAPALSADLGTLYVAVSNGNAGYLLALDSTTLAPLGRVRLKDPKSGLDARLSDNGSASPTVGTDGDVYFGVLESPQGTNNSRGWLLHFDSSLSQSKTPGAFGWDTTVSLVPAPMVPSYQGTSAYLLMTKYNNYAQRGGDGQNKLAVLDPNATQTDPVTLATVMKEVLTIVGPTPDPNIGGVREWCINSAVADPATKSILANNEDGKLYRWDLTTNTLSQTVVLTAGLGQAYTSTLIGVDGHVYAINNAILFAVGQ